MRCHLLIPDLIWPEPADLDTLGEHHNTPLAPALTALLASTPPSRGASSSNEQRLADLCGLPDAPLAPLRLLGEAPSSAAASSEQAYWLCADPIHLRLAQEQVFAAGNEALALSPDEASALISALNQTFSDIGHFYAATPDRWYLRLQQPQPFPAPPASTIVGRRLGSQLPKGKPFAPLLSFLIEAQMLLHSHPVNHQREERGQITANSLWLWGGGDLSAPSATTPAQSSDIAQLWSDDALACGIARHLQWPCQPLPADAAALLQATSSGSAQLTQLVLLDQLSSPTRLDDGYRWRQTLEQLEHTWFAPLHQALTQGRIECLRISSGGSYGSLHWQIERPSSWQLLQQRWRKHTPLATLAQRLADTGR